MIRFPYEAARTHCILCLTALGVFLVTLVGIALATGQPIA